MKNEHPKEVSADDKVPFKEKLAYGIGGLSGGLSTAMESTLIKPIFVATLGISPGLIGLFDGVYRIWDAITDGLMGWLSDNTRTRWGRRRPYLVLGAVLMSLWMPMLWMFNTDWHMNTIIIWMVVANLVLFLFSTIWNVPYNSMLFEISPSSRERTNVAAFRAYFGKTCWALMGWVWYLTQLPIFADANGDPDPVNGARWLSCIGAVFVLICCLVPAFFCKERYYAAVKKQKKVKLWAAIKSTFQNRPFHRLLALAVLLTLAQSSAIAMGFFVELEYVCQGDHALASKIIGLRSTLTLFTGFAAIPLVQWMANRYGKRFATMFVLVMFLLWGGSSWFTFNPDLPYLVMFNGVLFSIANTGIWLLIPSMTSDVVDYDELLTEERREGMFSSVFSWIFKLAMTLGTMISGFFVVWIGYDAELSSQRILQPDDVIFNMRIAIIVMPTIFMSLALFVMSRYPLTTSKMEEVRVDLEARRGEL